MLIMFRAKNFASFKDDVILDLRRTTYREHPNHTFKCGEFELLKTIAIFGANASGKSNLISALSSFEEFMFSQFFTGKADDDFINESEIDIRRITIKPFLLLESTDKEIEFEIVFSHNDYLFQYGYSIEDSKICTEWLLINNEEVFERKKGSLEVVFGDKYIDILKEYNKLREDRLYLAILDYFAANNEIREIIDSFKEYFELKFNVYFELILETTIKGSTGVLGLRKEFVENENFREKVSEYVRKIDVGIKEIIIEDEIRVNKRTGEEKKTPVPKAIHNIYDAKGNVVGEKLFDLKYESSGTLRFISFIQEILKIMDNGGVFIVDELSSRLHPLLTKFLVELFQSDLNIKNSQLIFTTHDVSIMNKDQFRRDEVALIDKNEMGVSSLYTLADLGVRQDATFNKDYFRGKYGAIPIVEYLLDSKCGE